MWMHPRITCAEPKTHELLQLTLVCSYSNAMLHAVPCMVALPGAGLSVTSDCHHYISYVSHHVTWCEVHEGS
jgi:hypothetical protein